MLFVFVCLFVFLFCFLFFSCSFVRPCMIAIVPGLVSSFPGSRVCFGRSCSPPPCVGGRCVPARLLVWVLSATPRHCGGASALLRRVSDVFLRCRVCFIRCCSTLHVCRLAAFVVCLFSAALASRHVRVGWPLVHALLLCVLWSFRGSHVCFVHCFLRVLRSCLCRCWALYIGVFAARSTVPVLFRVGFCCLCVAIAFVSAVAVGLVSAFASRLSPDLVRLHPWMCSCGQFARPSSLPVLASRCLRTSLRLRRLTWLRPVHLSSARLAPSSGYVPLFYPRCSIRPRVPSPCGRDSLTTSASFIVRCLASVPRGVHTLVSASTSRWSRILGSFSSRLSPCTLLSW